MGAAAVPAAVTMGAGALSAYEQRQAGQGAAAYYNYVANTARVNQKLALAEGEAEVQGIGTQQNQAQQELQRREAETIGEQKAALATGVGLSSRSAQDVVKDTLSKSELDQMALRMNAELKTRNARFGAAMGALNYGEQATGFDLSAGNAISASRLSAASSLLGAAGSVANSWYVWNLYASRPQFAGGY